MASASAPVFYETEPLLAHIGAAAAQRVVLANGCFDPLHVGHIRYLREAAARGDFLVVALNSDESTRRLKGADRPIVTEMDRAEVLAGLEMVDAVLVSGEDDVLVLIEALRPDVHAQGMQGEGS